MSSSPRHLPRAFPTPLQHLCLRLLLLIALASTLLLSACGTVRTPPSTPALPPAALTAPCEPPPPLTQGTASAVLLNHVQTMERYTQCATRHRSLTRWLQSQQSTPAP